MSSCPCCNEDLVAYVNNVAADQAHSATITFAADTTESSVFGDGPYGSITTCKRNGTAVINSYCPIGTLQIGNTASVVFSICDTNVSAMSTTVSNIGISLDANGAQPADWSYTFRINDDVTITSIP